MGSGAGEAPFSVLARLASGGSGVLLMLCAGTSLVSPKAIWASLSEAQREILACGPTTFAEADALPEGLFEEDCCWDRESGDEWFVWEPTVLGREVRALAEMKA